MAELDAEERRLLQRAEEPPRRGRPPKDKDDMKDSGKPESVDKSADKADEKAAKASEKAESKAAKPEEKKAKKAAKKAAKTGNPAIPAQMDYDGDEWAGMPAQMRHDEEGKPVK